MRTPFCGVCLVMLLYLAAVCGYAQSAAPGPVFKLRVARGVGGDARPAIEDIMVFSWAPFNAGVGKNNLYAFLGLLPRLAGTEIDITAQYLTKLKEWRKLKPKRYHVPLEGSRMFVRVLQQVNGWVNEVGMFRASALVPTDGGRWGGSGRRYAGKVAKK